MRASLQGRVVVLTGASAGIGREACRAFAAEGARVVAAARRADRLAALREELEAAGAECLNVATNVAEREQVERLLQATLDRFGRVDVWINNAGSGLLGSIEQTTPEEMERLWRVNYMGAFYGCQAALRVMRRQGCGHLMNVTSMVARMPLPLAGAYTATKYALDGLSETLAIELAGTGIHVTTLRVGYTETEFGDAQVRKLDEPEPPAGLGPPAASAASVARIMVRCAQRPRRSVTFLPLAPLSLAVFDLFPGLWPWIGRQYVRVRTRGRGVPW